MLTKRWICLTMGSLIASGTALAQSKYSNGILDSYTAGLLACECAKDHPDGHGTLEIVRKSEEMRAKAWETNSAPATSQAVPETIRPESMAANNGSNLKQNGSRPSGVPADAK